MHHKIHLQLLRHTMAPSLTPVAPDNCRAASTVNVAARIAQANNLMARIVVPKNVLIYMLFFEKNIFHKSLTAKWTEALFRLHKIIFGG